MRIISPAAYPLAAWMLLAMATACQVGADRPPTPSAPLSTPTSTKTPSEPEGALAFSARMEDNLEIYLIPDMRAPSPEPVRLTFDPGNDYGASLSPDGKLLAFNSNRSGDDDIYLLRIETGSIQNLTNTPSVNESSPSWSPDGSQLAYMAPGDGSLQIFVMNADGTDVRQLTDNSGMDRYPVWSPDGTQIAFSSEMEGRDLEIYVMDADGSHQRRLTNTPGSDDQPSWSPDGQEIVYVRNASASQMGNLEILNVKEAAATAGQSGSRMLTLGPHDHDPVWSGDFIAYSTNEGSGPYHIRIVTSEGVEVDRIEVSSSSDRDPTWVSATIQVVRVEPSETTMPLPIASRTPPQRPASTPSDANTPTPSVVSPDGLLVFVSSRGGNNELYLADFSSGFTLETRLTFDPADDHRPALAPDGRSLAFVSDRHGNDEIYLMQLDQLGVQRVTNDLAEDGDPAWSPDGQWIAFRSRRDGNNELYLMRPDGSDVTRLTNYSGDDLTPAWSPDGSQIAFMSARDGNLELYLMRMDGSEVRRLTNNPGVDGYPSWSPDGNQIAFHSEREGGVDIYLLDLEAALQSSWQEGITRLSGNPKEDRTPVWHGDFLAYMSVIDDDFDIVVANLSGELVIRIGSGGAFDGFPTWASLR